jgi:hypothetical protein
MEPGLLLGVTDVATEVTVVLRSLFAELGNPTSTSSNLENK